MYKHIACRYILIVSDILRNNRRYDGLCAGKIMYAEINSIMYLYIIEIVTKKFNKLCIAESIVFNDSITDMFSYVPKRVDYFLTGGRSFLY